MPRAGLGPALPKEQDFKSCVATITPPGQFFLFSTELRADLHVLISESNVENAIPRYRSIVEMERECFQNPIRLKHQICRNSIEKSNVHCSFKKLLCQVYQNVNKKNY